MKKLAIVTTHPIQYNAPLFTMLHERGNLEIKVFYTWSQSASGEKYDPGFGQKVSWDIPLLAGYPYQFVNNVSELPGSSHFKGIDNPTLIGEIEDWSADAILVYGWSFKSHLKAMRHFHKKIPVLFRGDSTLLNDTRGLKSVLRHWFLRWLYRHVDAALYAGAANKRYFLKAGLREDNLYFMPHVVDNDRFADHDAAVAAQAKNLRNDLKIPEESCVFVFAGKLEGNKNPQLMINAFLQVGKENSHLIFAGSGPLERELKSLALNNDNIHFIGFQNQKMMPAVYHCADVYVLPSRSETWGLGINEAMAAGLAILCSDRCGCAEDLVQEHQNGFVFANNDGNSLATCLKKMITGEADVVSLGKRSKEIIKDWSFTIAAKKLETTVAGILKS